MKTTIVSLGALAVAASLSFAQDISIESPAAPDKGQSPENIFMKLDTNADGVLSLDEFKASPRAKLDLAKAEEIYKKMDADSDGNVTLEEFLAFLPQHTKRGGNSTAPAPPEEPVK